MNHLIELFNKEQELAQQLLELDESDHQSVLVEKALNLKDMANSVDRYAWFFQLSDNKIDFIKSCIKDFQAQIKTIESRQSFVRDLIKNEMINNEYISIVGITKKINLQSSKLTMKLDESKIPASYYSEVVTLELNRDKLLSDLMRGTKVDGAELTQNKHIRIYNNSSTKTAKLIKGDSNE